LDERYFEQELSSFPTFTKASIDTSSLLVLDRLQLLDHVLSSLTIWVSPGVYRELGVHSQIGRTIAQRVCDTSFEPNTKVDEEVVLLAQKRRLSIISEDRKILQKAELLNLQAYPSGLLISFLVYAGCIPIEEGESRWQEMRLTYPYRKDLDLYCDGFIRFLRRSL